MDRVQGKVSWIEGYGVFVDVALADGRTASGLIHKSELSWGVVAVPEAVVSVGATHLTAAPMLRRPRSAPHGSFGRHSAFLDQEFHKLTPENMIFYIRSGPPAQHLPHGRTAPF